MESLPMTETMDEITSKTISENFCKVFFGSMALWTLLLAGVVYTARAAEPSQNLSAEEIVKKTSQNIYSGSEESLYVMKLAPGGGGSDTLRKMKVLYKRGGPDSAKLLIKFLEPADIRGTGLLSVLEKDKPADQWIYLPALKKTRRIKGGNESESFLGSDFTVGDLTSVDTDTKRYDTQVTSSNEACGAGKCYVLTAAPKSGVEESSLPYSKKVFFVRKDNFITDKVEFYNLEKKLEKVLTFEEVHSAGAAGWLADKMVMKNLLSGHSTVIEVSKRDTVKAPNDSAFTQSSLERN
jgi:hypothetical protein